MNTDKSQNSILVTSTDKRLIADIEGSHYFHSLPTKIVSSYQETIKAIDATSMRLIIVDIEETQMHEMDLVNYIKTKSSKTEIIILTTIQELENATYSLRRGASLYLIKPVLIDDLQRVCEKILSKVEQHDEYKQFEQQVLFDLMAGNPAMQKVLKLSMKIAPTSATVLIGGESGTGKEFHAKIIHRISGRPESKFIAVNCGAIPETLFESEFFGYKKGSFTGALHDKPGMVEEAHTGTLFLDEIGELSLQAQVKLLRFLQEHTFRRIGDSVVRSVNTRVIAATNKDLMKMVEKGAFREDLFYRLNVFYLYLPPLRERKETIPNLIRLFVHRNNLLLDKNINKISKAAELIIAEYEYPGNVRELENIIEHAMILTDTSEITEKELPEYVFKNRLRLSGPTQPAGIAPHNSDVQPIATLAELEEAHIRRVLCHFNYNYSDTAKKLGISRSTLWRKIKDYSIDKVDQ
ncbi:MAG: sigma-54-dependent Fis family transcriptional regulator [Chitinivibrionales bacterium]|nr:sigma-54-dependent Fis family transcriptional regulator [Chitinivibrionales bacterium]